MEKESKFCKSTHPSDILGTTKCVVRFLNDVTSAGALCADGRHTGISEDGECGLSYILSAVEDTIEAAMYAIQNGEQESGSRQEAAVTHLSGAVQESQKVAA